MPRYKEDLNAVYVSERMQECLRGITESSLTTVIAPMGYGKTTAILWFLNKRYQLGEPFFRVNIYSGDIDLFWKSFCAAFRQTALADQMEQFGFPVGKTAIGLLTEMIAAYLLDHQGHHYLFVDDYHLMKDERVTHLLLALCDIPSERFHLIVASREAFLLKGEELYFGRRLHSIVIDDLRLSMKELAAYTRKCGLALNAVEIAALYERSEGWISFIYLNLKKYREQGMLLQENDTILSLIGGTLIAPLSRDEQIFLQKMCLADEFTLEQAEFIAETPGLKKSMSAYIHRNAFIRYLPDTGTYRFHHMLRAYMNKQLEMELEDDRIDIFDRYGAWHESVHEYTKALTFYEKSRNYSAWLRVIARDGGATAILLEPEKILLVLAHCPMEALEREPGVLPILMRFFYSHQMIPKMLEIKRILEDIVERTSILSEEDKQNLLGECDLNMSFLAFNDIRKMSEFHRRACRRMTKQANSFTVGGSFTFGQPSVLMLYHRTSGQLSIEIEAMNESMPYFYRLTASRDQGCETLMEAEAAFYRGELIKSQLLLAMARREIEAKGQRYLLQCCDLLALRLGVFSENRNLTRESRDKIKQQHNAMLLMAYDSVTAYYEAMIGQKEHVPMPFSQHLLGEESLLPPAKPMFSMIENQVYLAQQRYIEILAQHNAVMGLCQKFHYPLVEIHLNIQRAAAHEAVGQRLEALVALRQAMDIAMPDQMILPFVENNQYIKKLLVEMPKKYKEKVQMIFHLAEIAGQRVAERCSEPVSVLTEREHEVARLAAEGKTRREISEVLQLSEHTVKNHLTHIFDKLNITGTPKQRQNLLEKVMKAHMK